MKYKSALKRIALYMKALYFQRFAKILILYLILATIFIASTSLVSLAVTSKVSFIATSQILIFSLLPQISYLVILLYVSKSFVGFHDRKTSSLLLIAPASSLEKYSGILLFYFLSYIVLGTIVLSISQLLASIITEVIVNHYHNTFNSMRENLHPLSQVMSKAGDSFYKIIEKFGYFFLAAVLFKKNQFIKAILIIWALYSLQATYELIIHTTKSNILQQLHHSIPFKENIFMIGSLACIIIGYFRFSKLQYS